MAKIRVRHKDVEKRNDPIIVVKSEKTTKHKNRVKVFKYVLYASIFINVCQLYLLLK